MILIIPIFLPHCWISEKRSRHSSMSRDDVRSEEPPTTLFNSDGEVHGIAAAANLDRETRFTFRAVHNECELTPIPAMP
jgi:hypothetical protein